MAMDFFSKANEAFVEENYDEAVQLYTKAIEEESSKDDFYVNRAHAFIKLNRYTDALTDCTKALELNSKNSKAYLRKGISHFNLDKWELAKKDFEDGQRINSDDSSFVSWLQKCEEKLKAKQSSGNEKTTDTSDQAPQPDQAVSMPAGPKTRYDWYQTETYVIVTIMLKNVKKDDFMSNIQERSLSCTVKLPGGTDYSLELDLAHEIKPNQTQIKVMSTKVEIKLKKVEGLRWSQLEGDGQPDTSVKHFVPDSQSKDSAARKYPSSSHYTRDWDKLVADIKQEEKEEKPEGDAALNSLFQQIYSDGSDEVRKAMNKSFYESGGTVLSTNWNEIGTKKTDIKPPDGMEFKKWDA